VDSHKQSVGNSGNSARNSGEFDTLQSQLDEFLEQEKSEIDSSQTGSTKESQQRLDAFVESLEQQMDNFASEASENSSGSRLDEHIKPDVLPEPSPTGQQFSSDKKPVSAPIKRTFEIGTNTAAQTASYGKLITWLLGATGLVVVAVLWFVWPGSMVKAPEQSLVITGVPKSTPQAVSVPEIVVPPVENPATDPVDILLPELVITVAVGNIRDKPSSRGRIVTKLKQGAVISQLEQQGEWFKVQLQDNSKAWAHKSIVVMKQTAAVAEGLQTAADKVESLLTVTVNIGNIRNLPNSSGDVLFRLKLGSVVTQLKREGDWFQVRLANGTVAWAHESIF